CVPPNFVFAPLSVGLSTPLLWSLSPVLGVPVPRPCGSLSWELARTSLRRARTSIRATARERKIMRKITLAAIVLIAAALAACGQGHSETKAAAPPPPQVTVAKPVTRQVADQDEYVGRFVAIESVEVRARVSGYLEAIHFQDGQIVHKNDLLFT